MALRRKENEPFGQKNVVTDIDVAMQADLNAAKRQKSVALNRTNVLYYAIMVELLKYALEKERFDAAAYAIVYGLIKVKKDGKKTGQKDNKTGFLRARPG
jgi:hypothetical protein